MSSRIFISRVTPGLLFLLLSAPIASALMSDTNLFTAVNLNYPGLEAVRSNVAQGNYSAAMGNFATYLRSRTNVTWYFDPHNVTTAVSYSQSGADQTTNGYISSIGIPYTFTNGVIDWYYNVTKDSNYSYADNNEWQWQINRMAFWPNLGSTYWGTGNDIYTKFWVGQLRSWLTNCPVPTTVKNGAGSTWRTIESGIRMGGNWPNTYHRFLHSPSFTDRDICDYVKSCIEHSRYLSNYFTSANWLTMEMSGLYTVGALYPELKEASGWRALAGNKLYMEETNQFYTDGVQKELSTGYHGVALGNILTIYNVAALEGIASELPSNYVAGLEKGYAHYLSLMAPDRTMPQFNDSISAANAQSQLTTAAGLFTNRQDFRWVASNGASGAPPAFVSFNYPWAGYSVMRSGWSRNDNYLCLDGGPLGSAHIHQDKLNVVLWAYGRRILFDSGGGQYETSIWRSYATSAFSHNTVIVDGQNQAGGDGSSSFSDPDYVSQTPVNSKWESDINHDYATGTYERGYGSYATRPAKHTRRVLFLKPDLYLVADTLVPNDTSSHTYEARWHLLPTNTVFSSATKSVATADSGQPNLAVVPGITSGLTVASVVARSNANYNQLLGWNITSSQSGPSPATTVTHSRSGTGTNQFLTLLMPLAAGATNPVTNFVAMGATGSRLELSDGRRLILYSDPNPNRGLRLLELLEDGSTNRIAGGGFTQPVISSVLDQETTPGIPVGPLPFTVGEPGLSPTNLYVLARSLNSRVVPDSGIALSGTGSNRTVTVTAATGRAGTAPIRLTVVDTNGATATTEFTVTITVPPVTSYYWDTSTNPGLQAGNSVWSGIAASWSSNSAGSNPLLPWPAMGNDAVFFGSGGTCTVSVSGTQNVNHLAFSNGTFQVASGTLNHFAGPMKVAVHSNATLFSQVIADTDLVKSGTGNLTLAAPAVFTGDLFVNQGAVSLSGTERLLPTSGLRLGEGSSAGALDLSAGSQTFSGLQVETTNSLTTNIVAIGASQQLRITGPVLVGEDNGTNSATRLRISGAGSLWVTNAGQNFTVGMSVQAVNAHGNSASLDLTRLGRVTLGTSQSPLGELQVGYGRGSGSTTHALTLSDTNNLITAAVVHVGNSIGNNGSSGTLMLGAGSNEIWTDTLNIGLAKVAGTMRFASQAPGSPGTVVIRGKGGPATAIWVGYKNGTGTAANPTSTLDLRGHLATVVASKLSIAIENGSSTGGENASVRFDNGSFTVDQINIADKSGTSTGPVIGSLNVGGGVFRVNPGGSFRLATQTTASTASGTLNITGGNFDCYADILDGGGNTTSTLTLNGGNLNLFGYKLGSATKLDTLNFQSGTIQNVGEINDGTSPLIKTGSGTLILSNVNTYTGGTVLSAGTLVLAGSLNSYLSATGGTLSGSGSIKGNLSIASGAVFRPRINGQESDQITVIGNGSAVALSGALDVTTGVNLPRFSRYIIINNQGTNSVSGTFTGLPQNAVFQSGGYIWRISYSSGDGNDVELALLQAASEMRTIAIVGSGNTWKYYNSTNDPGPGWQGLGFNDAGWQSGESKLGYAITNGQPPATTVVNNGQITTLFRKTFVVPDPALLQSLSARMLRDDGAVVYLNASEIWRDNLPGGAVGFQTLAMNRITGTGETNWVSKTLAPAMLIPGTNVLAVEVHQSTNPGDDLSFDFELSGQAVVAGEPQLTGYLTGTDLLLAWPGDLGLFQLNFATNLTSPVNWARIAAEPVYSNGWWTTLVPISSGTNSYFRLENR